MATIPLTFRAAPFPEGYRADPEKLKNDIVARLYAESTQAISFFASGSVAPSSNVGPWLKNGTEWYVWSDDLAMYIPQPVPQGSLRYVAQFDPPDESIYIFWIQLDVTGKAIAIKYFSGGAWKDVYEDKFATYSTTTEMNTAIAAAIAGIPPSPPFAVYPAQGFAAGQAIPVDSAPHKIAFSVASINPAPAPFDTILYRYVAPADGIYLVSFSCQLDNAGANVATVQAAVGLNKNGVFAGNSMGDLDNTPSPNGSRWSPGFSGLIQLVASDYLEVVADLDDGVGVGNLIVASAQFSINRVTG